MKVNVQKLQIGGVVYKPLPSLPTREPAPKPAEAPLEKDLLESMIGEGITNDVMSYSDQVNQAYQAYSMLPEDLRNSYQGQMIRRTLKGDPAKLNAIKRNKQDFDKILTQKEKALDETAVSQGKVIVRDAQGALSNLSLGQYAQAHAADPTKYQALTNADVAQLRENDPRFAFNDNLVGVLKSATSTDEVVERVRKALGNLGSFSKGQTAVSYEQQRIEDGANAALNQGLSYIKTSEGESKQSNAENIRMAGNAMWATLDGASKDLLRVKAIHAGYKPEQIEGAAMGLAMALLKPSTTEKIIEKSGEVPGGGKGKTGSGDYKGTEGYYGALTGFDGRETDLHLNTGTNARATIKAFMMPGLMEDKDFVGISKFTDLKSLPGVADMNDLVMGDTRIPKEKLSSLVYDGGKVGAALMPFKTVDGHIQPDLDRQNDLSNAQKAIAAYKTQNGPNIPLDVKIGIYEKNNISDLTPKGDPAGTMLKPFIIMHGTTTTNVVKDPTDKVVVSSDDDLKNWYKKVYTKTSANGKEDVKNDDLTWRSDMVEGMVYIPMSEGAQKSAMFADKIGIKTSEYYNSVQRFNQVGLGLNEGPNEVRVGQPGNNSIEQLFKK